MVGKFEKVKASNIIENMNSFLISYLDYKSSGAFSIIPKMYPKVCLGKLNPKKNPIGLKNSQDLVIKSQVQ